MGSMGGAGVPGGEGFFCVVYLWIVMGIGFPLNSE